MRNDKGNGRGRTVGVTAIAIGLLSALFVGLNGLVFAAESSKTESIEKTVNVVDTAAIKNTVSEDEGELTLHVYELDSVFPDEDEAGDAVSVRKDSAIPAEEAAQIGAQHIREIFDEDIDGSYIVMFYEASNFTGRTYWTGLVAATKEDLDEGLGTFMFNVDAVSGEKKTAHMFRDYAVFQEEEAKEKEAYPDDDEKNIEISIKYEKRRKEYARELYLEDPDAFAEIARETAARHFKNTEVAEVVYLEDRSNDGIVYSVTDNTGHEIEVAIYSDTRLVEFVDDRVDEVDPSFVPDPNGVG